MKVLVDFDNVPVQIRRYGPLHIVDRLVTALKPALAQVKPDNLDFRLYGGWDENNKLTIVAQEISATLKANFPKIINSQHADPAVPLRLSATIAQSLEALPNTLLSNTLRSVPVQKEFKCIKPSAIGCKIQNCPIDALTDFLTAGACPTARCLSLLRQYFGKGSKSWWTQ